MTATILLDRPVQALTGADSYWAERHVQPDAKTLSATVAMSIALSGEVGTPASEVAHETGSRLGSAVYDHQLPERIAQEFGLPVRVVEQLDERSQHWLSECVEGFALASLAGESAYMRHLARIIRSLANKGSCVIVGRGAAHFLPTRSTLRVRLVGALEDRITVLSRRLRVDREEGARRLQQLGQEQARFIRKHFHMNANHAPNYDLVLNVSQLTVMDCAATMVRALHNRMAVQAEAASLSGALDWT